MKATDHSSSLTAEQVRELLAYDPETGQLTWKRLDKRHAKKAGHAAGTLDGGYIRVSIRHRNYSAHRLIWLIWYGRWPSAELDHRDLDKTNNRIDNLRECIGGIVNSHNFPPRRSGLSGTSLIRESGKWSATIKIMRRSYNLGTFETEELAHEAYVLAKRRHHPASNL